MKVTKESNSKENKLINPIIIDPIVIDPIIIDDRQTDKFSEKSEAKPVNPITIDHEYLSTKEQKTQEEERLKSTSTSPIVADSTIIQQPSQNIVKMENPFEQIFKHGIPEDLNQYLFARGLNYDVLNLLKPQVDNSIGGAKGLLSVLSDVVYRAKEKKMYLWNGEIWEHITESQFKKRCVKLLELQYDMAELCGLLNKDMIDNGKNSAFEGIISMIKNISDLPDSQFDSAERVLCLKNGIFSFDDFKLHPFEDYKYSYITKQIDCNYYPNATSDVVNNFLLSIMGDYENVRFLQQIFGYSIIGHPIEQKAFILEGNGSNGKSTLLGALHDVLGEFITSIPVSYFTGDTKDDPNRPSPATYSVKDKLIVYTSETQCSSFLNESRVKKFIGGGKLKARPPYGQLVEFDNHSTLFFDTNHLPHFKSGGFLMERRLIVVPFPYTFTKDKMDVHLPDKLRTQRSKQALLTWLINGAINYLGIGHLKIPQRVHDATNAFFREEDTIGQFLEECTVIDINSSVPFHELYDAYKKFCDRNCIEYKSADTFSKSKKIQNFPVTRGKIRCRKGLRLANTRL